MNAERNDILINPLFTWGKEFELVKDGEVVSKVYMRLVGDADLNRARVYALRKSSVKRSNLKDRNSDENLAFLQEEGILEREKLIALCVLFTSKEITQKAIKEVQVKFPKEPKSDATLEAFEKFQKEIDDFPEKRDKEYRKFINKEIAALETRLATKSDHELYLLYIELITNELCEEEMLNSFREMCTYCGSYSDPEYKTKFFGSLDDFLNLDSSIKRDFMDAYQSLEIPTEELKKLREATQ
jgi:hypothetical protein